MLSVAGQRLDPHLIVFDKDGTLIVFDEMWHTWFDHLMEAIASQVPLDSATREGFAGTLGYDPKTGEWDSMGPLTIASTSEVALLMAGQIYRYQNKTWDEALAIIQKAETIARSILTQEDLAKPIGDVRATLHQLRDRGILLALATTDERTLTELHLQKLDIVSLFATTVCGDDGIPLKPAPDMGIEICRRLDVAPHDTIMIGDTVADLIMAREAGFSHAIAVTSGAVSREKLAPYADLVIPDIHAIKVE